MRLRTRLVAVIALVFLPVILWASLSVYKARLKKQAEDLLVNLSGLSQSRDFSRVQNQLGARLKPLEGCTSDGCQYEVVISNQLLAATRLATFTEMRAGFAVSHGLVDFMLVSYRTAPKTGDGRARSRPS